MTRGYTTNGLNQYNPVGGVSYSYDLNGNLTSDGTRSYVYDNENLPVGASCFQAGGGGAAVDGGARHIRQRERLGPPPVPVREAPDGPPRGR